VDGAALAWWQRGAIYQIYPRSFADAGGDGIGDLRGIAARLDHLEALAVEAIWLSPFFPSPMADFGYDVANYCDVDPLFGDLADFDALVAACHARGIRVVIDWVPNHTSDRHPWFESARRSRADPRRDWYVWRDPAPDGGPPNDWRSVFQACGPAWTLDPRTGQYYLHSFMPQQPDLNWDNPAVEAAMHDVLRFWLDRGVDGFRLDAIAKIAKDPLLRSQDGAPRRHDEDWDSIHDRLRGIRRVIDAYDERMLVGEVALDDLHRIVSYLQSGDQLHLAHNFVWVELPWDADAFRTSIADFESLADEAAWPAWFLSNHDLPRTASRFDDAEGRGPARARAIALMLYALRGTPFVYQGEELGLRNATIGPEHVVDVDGRDGYRTPMPWQPPSTAGAGAGFTTGDPWLPVHADAEKLCVERQAGDPASTLTLVRALAALRRATPALQCGTQSFVEGNADVLAWHRELDGDRLLVAINFATEPAAVRADLGPAPELLISTDPGRAVGAVVSGGLTLGASEAVIVRM
jgi:alpha-glucosidase